MKGIFKYSIVGITILFLVYLGTLFVLVNTVFEGQELPEILASFSFSFLGFWLGMLFMRFIYRTFGNSKDNNLKEKRLGGD